MNYRLGPLGESSLFIKSFLVLLEAQNFHRTTGRCRNAEGNISWKFMADRGGITSYLTQARAVQTNVSLTSEYQSRWFKCGYDWWPKFWNTYSLLVKNIREQWGQSDRSSGGIWKSYSFKDYVKCLLLCFGNCFANFFEILLAFFLERVAALLRQKIPNNFWCLPFGALFLIITKKHIYSFLLHKVHIKSSILTNNSARLLNKNTIYAVYIKQAYYWTVVQQKISWWYRILSLTFANYCFGITFPFLCVFAYLYMYK